MHHPESSPTRVTLRARLFGSPEITVNGRVLGSRDWPGRRARPMLLMLLATPGHALHREQIADALWPELGIEASRNAFFKTLHTLRRTLEPELKSGRRSRFIDSTDEVVRLAPELSHWIDVDQFTELLTLAASSEPDQRRRLLRQALDLVRGELVADAPYDDWVAPRRRTLNLEHERAVLSLAEEDLRTGEPLATLPYLDALVARDPTIEAVHRATMHAYVAAGQPELALRRFEQLRVILNEELGDEPEPETVQLAESIRELPEQPTVDAVRQTALSKSRSLPALPTPTIGRLNEIAAISQMLEDPAVRLATILGTGGVGKTRLATHVALQVRDQFPDGVGFVALAAIVDPSLLFASMASALDLVPNPRLSARDVVTNYLQRRAMLLILDNLEHLVEDIAPDVAILLEACPDVTILATSRVPLNIRAERRFPLDVLELPTSATVGSSSLETIESTALFLQSARAMDYRWSPASRDRDAIAGICLQCDGLPLAIELAAARCDELTPAEILLQLEHRPRVMTLRDGPRDLPARHRGLSELVRWSYDLLPPEEQELFRHLSVFAGGVETDALEALGGERAVPLANTLADKNLAKWIQVGGGRRLILLETIREVAGQLLAEQDDESVWHERHARYYAGLLRRLHHTASSGKDQIPIVARLDRDIDNVRVAISRAMTSEMVPSHTALEIAAYSSWYWFWKGYTREGLARLDAVMAHYPAAPTSLRFLGAYWLATYALRLLDLENFHRWKSTARELADETGDSRDHIRASKLESQYLQRENRWDESLALNESLLPLCRELGDQMLVIDRLNAIASCLQRRGEIHRALELVEESLELSRAIGAIGSECITLLFAVGMAHDLRDLERTERYVEAAQRTAILCDNKEEIAWSTYQEVGVASLRGDHSRAANQARRAARLFAEYDIMRMVGGALQTAAVMEAQAGNTTRAFETHLEAVEPVRTWGTPEEHMSSAMEAGYLCISNGEPSDGLALVAYAAHLIDRVNYILPDAERESLDEHIGAARGALTPATFDAAWARGWNLSLDEAMDLVALVCQRAIGERDAEVA